jgi:hypothetical protein
MRYTSVLRAPVTFVTVTSDNPELSHLKREAVLTAYTYPP